MKRKLTLTLFVLFLLAGSSLKAQLWTTVEHDATINRSIAEISFAGITGYAVGQHSDGVPWGSRGLVYKTIDDGQTWSTSFIPLLIGTDSIMGFNSVDFVNTTTGYVTADCYTTNGSVGLYYGAVLKTTNGGTSWSVIYSAKSLVNYATQHVVRLNDVFFSGSNNGFVCGGETQSSTVSDGRVLVTTNGGTTWTMTNTVAGSPANASYFNSITNGTVAGGTYIGMSAPYNGTLSRTTNGGTTWTTTYTDNGYGYVDVTFYQSLKGWAVGDSMYMTFPGSCKGKVVRTTDNGQTWSTVAYLPNFRPNCVYFVNDSVGFIGGETATGNAGLIKTTDHGQSWTACNYPDINNNPGSFISTIGVSSASAFAANDYMNSNSIYSANLIQMFNCSVYAGPPTVTACQQDVNLTAAFSPNSSNIVWNWSPSAGTTGPLNTPNLTVHQAYNQPYLVTATDTVTGCTAYDTITVTAFNANVGTLYLCPGDSLTLDFGPGATSYNWQTFTDTNNVTTPINVFTQTLVIHDPGSYLGYAQFPSCGALTSLITVVDSCYTAPLCSVDAGPDTTLCGYAPNYFQLSPTATGSGNYSYSWSPSTGLSSTTVANPYANNAYNITYTLTLTDNGNGCTATDTVHVTNLTVNIDTAYSCSTTGTGATFSLPAGGSNYTWNGPNGFYQNSTLNSVYVTDPGNYLNISMWPIAMGNCVVTNLFTLVDSCNVAVPNVWPGDCNYDLQANMADALQIGLGYGATGATRPSATNGWYAQPMADWAQNFINCNYKHADADGNGTIDVNDTIPISLNYGLNHPYRLAQQQDNLTAPTLILVPNYDTTGAQTLVTVDIRLGDNTTPVDSLYGISFRLNMDASLIDTNLTTLSYAGTWLGSVGSNMFTFTKAFPSSGIVDAAQVRNNHIDRLAGNGTIATLSIVTTDNLSGISVLHLGFSDVHAVTTSEMPISLNIVGDSVILDPSMPAGVHEQQASNNYIAVYPNPSRDEITVTTAATPETITLTDMLGRTVLEVQPSTHITKLNVSSLAKGVYVLHAQTASGEITEKLTITR